MSARHLSDLFLIGIDMLATFVDSATNTILANLGDNATQTTTSPNADCWQHAGFVSRPPAPVAGVSAAQCIAIRHSERDTVIAERDVRTNAMYGTLKDGETCLYAAGGTGTSQGRVLIKQDGSVTLYTTDDNTKNGKGVCFQITPTAFSFAAPWGSIVFDASGFHLKTKAGPRIDMGGVSIPGLSSIAPAGLVNAVTAYAKITAPTITVKGGVVNLGPGPAYNCAVNVPSSALAGVPVSLSQVAPTNISGAVRLSTP